MKRIQNLILTSVLIVSPIIFTGCSNDEAKQDENVAKTGNTVTDSNTQPHNVANQQNMIDKKDNSVPDNMKDNYIRNREIVGNGKGSANK